MWFGRVCFGATMTQPSLSALRSAQEVALESLRALISARFPGCNEWHWYRALHAVRGDVGRRTDDTSNDIVLATDTDIESAHDEYIRRLHVFYEARDGAGGFLGGRGL